MFLKKKSQPVSSASNTSHIKNGYIFPSAPLCKVSCFEKTDSCLRQEQIQGWQSLQTACWLLLRWLLSLPVCFALPSSAAYPAWAVARGGCASPEPPAPPGTAPRARPRTRHATAQSRCLPACTPLGLPTCWNASPGKGPSNYNVWLLHSQTDYLEHLGKGEKVFLESQNA